jgi:20S proteasome subunit beta 3
MDKDELFEVVSQSLLAAMDRDSYSGWGATVYILTPDELIVKNIKTRQD